MCSHPSPSASGLPPLQARLYVVDYEALGFGEDVCEDVMWTLHEMIEAGVESGEVGRGGGAGGWLAAAWCSWLV